MDYNTIMLETLTMIVNSDAQFINDGRGKRFLKLVDIIKSEDCEIETCKGEADDNNNKD